MSMFNDTVDTEAGEVKETSMKPPNSEAADKTEINTQQVEEASPDDKELSVPLPVCHPPKLEVVSVSKRTTRSSIPVAADEPYESAATVALKCADEKPEVERVSVQRKLIVVRGADIRRSRSADIFRQDDVAATSGPATARAQSETRDVTYSWNALSRADQKAAVENLTSLVCAVKFAAFQHFISLVT